MSARRVRRFQLERDVDVSGVSGTGAVAFGAQSPDGTCVLWWKSGLESTAIYPDMETLLAIHGHNGMTRAIYIDPEITEDEAEDAGGSGGGASGQAGPAAPGGPGGRGDDGTPAGGQPAAVARARAHASGRQAGRAVRHAGVGSPQVDPAQVSGRNEPVAGLTGSSV